MDLFWHISFGGVILLSVIAFVLGMYYTFGKYKKGRFMRPVYVLMGFCFLSVVILNLPATFLTYWGEAAYIAKSVACALQRALKVFGADEMFDYIFAQINTAPSGLKIHYLRLVMIIQILSPVSTFGFLLTLFRDIYALLKYNIHYNADMYIFSGLNEKAVALATDIHKNGKRDRIVFTDVNGIKGENSENLIEDAKELGAICFNKDVLSVNFGFHSKKKKLVFFVTGNDETVNINIATGIIDRYKNRGKMAELYVFSVMRESNAVLEGIDRGEMRVRRIDEARSVIYNWLLENSKASPENEEIFSKAAEGADGCKHIRAMIVGMGSNGTEMVKALSWYCQFEGYRVHIDAFDKDELALSKFSSACPDLMNEKYNGKVIDSEAYYDIKIHFGVDVDSLEFKDYTENNQSPTFIFVSLGYEQKNVEVAVNLRSIFARLGTEPIIYAIAERSQTKDILKNAKNFDGNEYKIKFMGDIGTRFAKESVINSELERIAHDVHMSYAEAGNEEEALAEKSFEQFEYNYRSSAASAIHRILSDNHGRELNEVEEAYMEHIRWNAYTRSEGYVLSENKNHLAKTHPDLLSWNDLKKKKPQEIIKDQNIVNVT